MPYPFRQHLVIPLLTVTLCLAGAASDASAQASSLVRDLRTKGLAPAPEGLFLIRQQCEMRRLGSNGWFLVFARPESGEALPPMIIHPCANLQAMQQLAATDTENSRFLVSGQVFIFNGRNYILPTLFALYDASPPTTPEQAEDVAPIESLAPSTDPEIADLIRALEQATSDDELAMPAVPTPASGGLLREGTIIASRPGRLERSDRAGWRLVFDTDVDSAPDAQPDAPIELLPCLNLQAMQEAVERSSDPKFLVSGRVFIYDGQNYLLPTLYFQQRSIGAGLSTAQ